MDDQTDFNTNTLVSGEPHNRATYMQDNFTALHSVLNETETIEGEGITPTATKWYSERGTPMTDTIMLDTLIDAELHPVPLTDRERLIHLADTYGGWGEYHDPDPDTSWLEPSDG